MCQGQKSNGLICDIQVGFSYSYIDMVVAIQRMFLHFLNDLEFNPIFKLIYCEHYYSSIYWISSIVDLWMRSYFPVLVRLPLVICLLIKISQHIYNNTYCLSRNNWFICWSQQVSNSSFFSILWFPPVRIKERYAERGGYSIIDYPRGHTCICEKLKHKVGDSLAS